MAIICVLIRTVISCIIKLRIHITHGKFNVQINPKVPMTELKGGNILEVRNLVKVYQTKGGAEVRAADGISLSFADKGTVFLLGKSGSGKSTLLNLCGGLDAPDDGEIVIKGKSLKSFSAADFDSYRNTFVGFVFQEYNILDEFSVADNIALALELQGKNVDIRIRTRIVADNACDSARNVNYRNFPARILNSPQKARGKYPRTVKSFDIRLKIKKGATGALFYSRLKSSLKIIKQL